ncbi:MAG: hypothetical protein ACJ8DC_00705 [Gemmatimonadales bacterium]
MTGHVFHPGHHELHGITVVIETHGPRTYIGRFDSEDQEGLHLLDAAIHEAAADAPSKEEYVRRSAKFGVRAEHKHLILPAREVARITRLGDVAQ